MQGNAGLGVALCFGPPGAQQGGIQTLVHLPVGVAQAVKIFAADQLLFIQGQIAGLKHQGFGGNIINVKGGQQFGVLLAIARALLHEPRVLFLDELAEFARPSLEALRQPLEEGKVTVVRGQRSVTYPAAVQLVAAHPLAAEQRRDQRVGAADARASVVYGAERGEGGGGHSSSPCAGGQPAKAGQITTTFYRVTNMLGFRIKFFMMASH